MTAPVKQSAKPLTRWPPASPFLASQTSASERQIAVLRELTLENFNFKPIKFLKQFALALATISSSREAHWESAACQAMS